MIVTWDNGSLTVEAKSGQWIWATHSLENTGKYYCEFFIEKVDRPVICVHVRPGGFSRVQLYGSPDRNTNMAYIMDNNGNNYKTLYPIRGYQVDDIVGVCIDIDNAKIHYYSNNIYCFTAEFEIVTLHGATIMFAQNGSTYSKVTANFGATSFKYPIPFGYTSYDGNQKYVKYKYQINPLAVYWNNDLIYIDVKIEENHILKIVDEQDGVLCDSDSSNDSFILKYSDVTMHQKLYLGIFSLEHHLIFKEEILMRREVMYRTKCFRSFTDYEFGYRLKNSKQMNQIEVVI